MPLISEYLFRHLAIVSIWKLIINDQLLAKFQVGENKINQTTIKKHYQIINFVNSDIQKLIKMRIHWFD